MEELVALEAPPRTLDVRQFAKARAAELLSLHTVLKKKKNNKHTQKRARPGQQDACISSSYGELQETSIRSSGDGDDDDEEDDQTNTTFTSLPRHLRRRTSSYTRRRRPLPWLYKKKRKAPPSSSLSLSLPNKRCKRHSGRQKKRKLQQQNCLDHSAGQGPPLASQVVVGDIASVGRDGIPALAQRGGHGILQEEVVASSSALLGNKQPELHTEQQNLRQLQQTLDCSAASSFQPSGDDIAPVGSDCMDFCATVPSVNANGISLMDVDSTVALVQMGTYGIQLEGVTPVQIDTDCTGLKSVDCTTAPTWVDGNAVQEEAFAFLPKVDGDPGALKDLDGTAAMVKGGIHGVHQDAIALPSQTEKDNIVSIGGDDLAAPAQACGHAAQQEALWQVGDCVASTTVDGFHQDAIALPSQAEKDGIAAPAQEGGHAVQQEALCQAGDCVASTSVNGIAAPIKADSSLGVQQEAISLPSQVIKDSTAFLGVDGPVAPPLLGAHAAQQDCVDLPSYVDVEGIAPMCIDAVPALAQVDNLEVEKGATSVKKEKRVCRALRRLLEFRPGGSLISSDGTRRLGTHIWHAKRFAMEKKWGYYIPVGRPGRGHGSRSILRWSKDKALLHDSSFINAIQLHGKEEKIMQVLRLVLEFPQGSNCYLEAGKTDSSWKSFSTALLHRVGEAPHKIISSVIVMWKPVIPELGTPVCAVKKTEDLDERDLWLWVHAAAFEEAFQALKDICCQLNREMKNETINCFSKRGDLGRLDLIGEKSFAVLQKVLFPVCRDQQSKCIKLHKLSEVIKPNQLKGKALVHMEVSDPRLKESERCLSLDPTLISPVRVFEDKTTKSQEFLEEAYKFAEEGIESEQEALGNLSVNTEEGKHDCCCCNEAIDALWSCEASSSQHKLRLPVKEKFLSRMRHTDRLDSFGLIQESVKINRMLERRKSLLGRFTCPLILLEHDYDKASACGWSIILPLSWISAFWVPLVFAGGHAIGIQERHWLYTDAGSPSFPDDFPDSNANAELMAAKSLQDARAVCERFTKKRSRVSAQISESAHEIDEDYPYTVGESCFVARTLERLVNHLQMTDQSGLLLFPAQRWTMEKFRGLGKRLHEGTIVWRAKSERQETRTGHSVQAVCLLRVSIRPFRKGVVEVGATLYAPTSEDYTVWSCMEKPTMTSESRVRTHDGSKQAVGYVTSMAPRGSKNCAGIAFCDAVALGLARGRQWVETTWHKNSEIFLMFRNKGSSTFRPAFATICLEAGPDI